ncbi:P4 family [Streptomyces coelicoflavus ZG0656]|nr:P4 family [Streptomyces coelicoflavus ZG0656]
MRFLTDTFGDDAEGREVIAYLQLLLGYSITGDVGGQILPFLFGYGKNGKSVLLDVLMKLLGDYADAVPPGFLMARPYEGLYTKGAPAEAVDPRTLDARVGDTRRSVRRAGPRRSR